MNELWTKESLTDELSFYLGHLDMVLKYDVEVVISELEDKLSDCSERDGKLYAKDLRRARRLLKLVD